MTCYHPYTVMYPAVENADGKRYLNFSFNSQSYNCRNDDYSFDRFGDGKTIYKGLIRDGEIAGHLIQIPCGRCIGCRLDYSRSWAVRAIHESMQHKDNTFVTLTFDDEHLPENRSLSKSYFSSWMKRFRKRFGEGIRFMACGEYGSPEFSMRPHYHVLFFGFKFPDQRYWSQRHGQIYYRSDLLESVWKNAGADSGNGYSVIGDVSFESAAYVSRYVTKKMFSKDDSVLQKHYGDREAEFLLTSRMPGLGHDFIVKNYKHILNNGFVVLPNGHKAPIPRYYLSVIQKEFPEDFSSYKIDKINEMYDNLFKEDINKTQQRLEAREELQKLKLDKLVRIYEYDALLHNI